MVDTVNKADLTLKIGTLELKNPIITASGTFGYNDEFEDYIDLSNIGAIITKGITLNSRAGNPQPRIREVQGGLINSIGLENVGIHSFIEHKLPVLKNKSIPYIVNIAGYSLEEYEQVAKICEDNNIESIELNVSCPNVKTGCLEFGRDIDMLYKLVAIVRQVFHKTLIVKLSSNISDPVKLSRAVEKAGADAISAVNTVKALNIRFGKNFEKSIIKGGLSGPVVKPIALNFVNEIQDSISIPIIGLGGVSSMTDILEFIAVGACAVQIGTANFTNPNISEKLAVELENFMIEHKIKNICELYRKVRDDNN